MQLCVFSYIARQKFNICNGKSLKNYGFLFQVWWMGARRREQKLFKDFSRQSINLYNEMICAFQVNLAKSASQDSITSSINSRGNKLARYTKEKTKLANPRNLLFERRNIRDEQSFLQSLKADNCRIVPFEIFPVLRFQKIIIKTDTIWMLFTFEKCLPLKNQLK